MRQHPVRTLWQTACVFVVCLPIALAQQQPEVNPADLVKADIQRRVRWAKEWLQSDNPQRIAWGAFLAKADRQRSLIPLLLQNLRDYQSVETDFSDLVPSDRHNALLGVLDALISLHAQVPVEEAHKLFPEFSTQAVILLVRAGSAAQLALLDVFGQARMNGNWLAAGNVLVKERTPGFAAALLSRFTQHIDVSVWGQGVGGGIGGGGGECGLAEGGPKQGWPPVGMYRLFHDNIFPEATLLIEGQTPVYFFREERNDYINPAEMPSCNYGNRDTYRAQYLAKLARLSYMLEAYPTVYISWEGTDNYKHAVSEGIEKQWVRLHWVKEDLKGAGLLTAEEAATLQPRQEVIISDHRSSRAVPLPQVLEDRDGLSIRAEFTQPFD